MVNKRNGLIIFIVSDSNDNDGTKLEGLTNKNMNNDKIYKESNGIETVLD